MQSIEVRVTWMFFYLPPSPPGRFCDESLHLIGDEALDNSIRTCNDITNIEQWNAAVDFVVNDELRMTYTKDRDSYGGRFWLQMEGACRY